ncbi:endonuclease I family protein [Myroides phaeus]|uniref:endonuclease I family protein n=1 Tax=Myroides phaeus TaxID=702745 RepID=UPI001302EC63|nr:endonuclease [Myroides phaeus]
MKKRSLLFLLGLSLITFSCTKDPIVTEPDLTPVEKPTKPNPNEPGEPGKPEEPEVPVTPNMGDYLIPAEYKDYYKGMDFTQEGMALKKQLAKLITKTHTPISYTPGIWDASEITDEDPDNPNNVIQIYGWADKDAKQIHEKRSVPKIDKNNGASSKPVTQLWEREHVFAKSLAVDKNKNQETLATKGYNGELPKKIEEIAGHDAHNLRPINRSRNSSRGNKKFVDAKGNSHAIGNYWYPGDEWKGDVARMMMYMHIRYENENGGGYTKATKVGMPLNDKTGILSDEMIDLFLKWNAEDPVSPFEQKRNTYHGNKSNPGAQGNRNPFIDNPELANRIWGMKQYPGVNKWK